MKVTILFFVIILLLLSTDCQCQTTIIITETSPLGLRFPTQIKGFATDVVLAPTDSGAASFSATGEPNAAVSVDVKENFIYVITGGGAPTEKMKVQNFTIDAPSNFDVGGSISSIRVGATALVKATNVGGCYTGTATLEVVY